MWKYLATLAVIFGLTIYVSIQNQRTTEQYAQQGTAPANAPASPCTHDEHTCGNAKDAKGNSPSWYALFTWPDGMTVWVIILTLIVVADQTKQTAIAAKATQESVIEGKDTAKRQLRAYLVVNIGGAVYQEREKNLKFEGKPLLVNTGQTPARKVRYKAQSAILPFPPSDNFVFQEVSEDIGFGILGAQQNATMGATVEEFCRDGEVEDIKKAVGHSLYVWGTVTYEDIFGITHYTKFGQQLYWVKNGADERVLGNFIPNHNDGD
jgi:hypothetical protein